ncbi:hypothetical protein GVN24_14940 [Rhizobium sp. CRIBSB]|nr:hypothetical protein [Rhizobium sp. CRIBSB]
MTQSDFARKDDGLSSASQVYPATPVTMDGMLGHLQEAGGSTGVVFCAPWGFDALCTVKFHRLVAADLARRGFPSIRFDYPGQGDSLPAGDGSTFEQWVNAALRAAAELRNRTGCSKVLYYGMGIGAAVAILAGRQDEQLAGYILAAGAVSGRRYLREVALREKVIEDGIDIDFGYPPGSTALASFIMDANLAAEMKQVTVPIDEVPPGLPALVLARPENAIDRQLADELGQAGAAVECLDFTGYGAMLDGVVTSPVPTALIETIGQWFTRTLPTAPVASAPRLTMSEPSPLAGNGFSDQPEVIDSHLFGVFCRPSSDTEKAVIILLNMAYASHIGWGGIWVDTARTLARRGIATLRVDLSNIGESPADPMGPDQVVYSDHQLYDVHTVIRHVRSLTSKPILLAGICSGAHSALYAGATNAEVAGIISINQLRLVLDPDEDVETLLMAGARPLSDYKRRAFSLGTYKRIISGEVDIPNAARNIASHAQDRISRSMSPYLGGLTKLGRLRGQLYGILRRLAAREVPVTFISCRTDGSLDQQRLYFGKALSGQRDFPGLRHILLENADHTLSPPAVRQQVIAILAEAAEQSATKA